MNRLRDMKLHYMQHAVAMAVFEQISQEHSSVQEEGRSETTVFGGGGDKGGDLEGVQRLWAPPQDGSVLQTPGDSAIVSGWWLSGGDTKPD